MGGFRDPLKGYFKGPFKGSFRGSLKGCFRGSFQGSLRDPLKGVEFRVPEIPYGHSKSMGFGVLFRVWVCFWV